MNPECAICLSDIELSNVTITECDHVFHTSCLLQNRTNKCPLCRHELYEIINSESDDELDNSAVMSYTRSLFDATVYYTFEDSGSYSSEDSVYYSDSESSDEETESIIPYTGILPHHNNQFHFNSRMNTNDMLLTLQSTEETNSARLVSAIQNDVNGETIERISSIQFTYEEYNHILQIKNDLKFIFNQHITCMHKFCFYSQHCCKCNNVNTELQCIQCKVFIIDNNSLHRINFIIHPL